MNFTALPERFNEHLFETQLVGRDGDAGRIAELGFEDDVFLVAAGLNQADYLLQGGLEGEGAGDELQACRIRFLRN